MSRKGSLLTLVKNSAAAAVAAVAEGGTASSSAYVVHGLFGTRISSIDDIDGFSYGQNLSVQDYRCPRQDICL